MTKTMNEKQYEQEHLDHILDKIKAKKAELKTAIKSAEGEARDLNSHFYDDVKLDFDGYSTSMETALSIHQQQQLLDERQNAWQHSAKQLDTVERLEQKPYFARVDFRETNEQPETIYIGLGSFADENNHFLIYDWRAPISSIYYDGKLGKVSYHSPEGEITVEMTKKRQFMIEKGKIVNMFDTNESIGDQMLLEVLSEKSSTQMKSIVTTIQQEQNKIIRNTSADLLFVQGAAGSGKTSAILQRIAYLLYRYRGNLTSSNVIMFSPNQLFNDYIKNVLPEMGEQNMVQMTYWQFVARRLPGMQVENLFDQFEDKQADTNINKFKDSTKFFKLVTRYAKYLNGKGVIFKDIYFRDKKRPYFSKEKIKEIYYSFNSNYSLANRIDATREELIKQLNRRITSEAKKSWVSETIQGLSKEQLNELYDRPDQEFESEEKEEQFLGRKIVVKKLKKVYNSIKQNHFINMRAQYLNFLRAVPKMIDLSKWGIAASDWEQQIATVKASFKERYIHMNDVSAYLYLYDLLTGRYVDFEMRYAFIDEIQDYTPFQLCYLKYNFPRAKYTMLGDLNQAIFTKDESQNLLKQISGLFDPEKTEVVQLTKSYRSTKQLTDFTKQILRQGEKIESFNRQGPKPALWGRDNAQEAIAVLEQILQENDRKKQTTAIITKNLADAKFVSEELNQAGRKNTLIATANQRLVGGTLVVPSYLAKGLEFDAVVMWDASKSKYHKADETQLVYTITSRAMYKLDIIYIGEKSPLLAVNPATYQEK
ncbi:RNA polymerase recycling motor HelD [Lactobacillus sp. ESL0791]|uniref:RNA polymerase recycling motor HelD n=1 Tax=Lactobacillus sp. ESL0791 TaxID=2983234 RepID=UPI0023F6F3E6|nr:RNA polymerase recycling motor HelD [Lactobacillus sp. ESL0791]MDF7639525.1 RNA polymerase recycling motor HelD [Lactobacillus sp. ESL0791]